jgi:tight adherence protein B
VNEEQHRVRLTALCLAVAAALWPTVARAGVQVGGVDLTSYPTARLSVVTSAPSAKPPVVRENGLPVFGVEAQSLGKCKSVALALDRSRSMAGVALSDASAAAASFVGAKRDCDRVGLVTFGSRAAEIARLAPSTTDVDSSLRSVAVDPKQGTALYDAVVLAANRLAADDQPGRVIIVLTDGQDVSSGHSLEQAVAAAKRAGAAVYPIGIVSRGFTPEPLEQLARETGGTYHRATRTGALVSVYRAIDEELSRTWRVSYVTAARPGERLSITASVPGAGHGVDTITVPGRSVSPAGPSGALPAETYKSPVGTFALMGAVAGLVLLAAAFVFASRKAVWLKNRVDAHTGVTKRAERASVRERFAVVTSLFRATEQAFGNLKQWHAVQRLLERAELPLRTVEFFYICVGGGFLLAFAGAVAAQPSIVILILLSLGSAAPLGFAWFKARRRLRMFEDQLPDLLITMAASLKAGHSFRQGLQSVVEEGQEPASKEFRRVLTETGLGRPMDDALGDMARRLGSKNFHFVITATTIQRQVGGSMAGLFDMVAETVRQRQQFLRKVRSLTAMGRMSAYVLVGLPFFMAGALTLLNRTYMDPLYHSSAGHLLIALSLVMILFGAAVLKKIVSFRG